MDRVLTWVFSSIVACGTTPPDRYDCRRIKMLASRLVCASKADGRRRCAGSFTGQTGGRFGSRVTVRSPRSSREGPGARIEPRSLRSRSLAPFPDSILLRRTFVCSRSFADRKSGCENRTTVVPLASLPECSPSGLLRHCVPRKVRVRESNHGHSARVRSLRSLIRFSYDGRSSAHVRSQTESPGARIEPASQPPQG